MFRHLSRMQKFGFCDDRPDLSKFFQNLLLNLVFFEFLQIVTGADDYLVIVRIYKGNLSQIGF